MTFASDFDRVSLTDVCYDYGRRRVLSRVSLSAQVGTITGVLGPNGAGKSTLLSVLATRAHPSLGSVRYGELPATTSGTSLRSRIGWLGHDPGFYPELSAQENLRFYARLHGVASVDAAVRDALHHAGLTARAGDAVGGFSRGMRQRLGLERVLLHSPRLVLLDEPFTGLDDASAAALLERLAGLRSNGSIVMLSTHDLDLVSGLLDRAVVLRAGKVADAFELSAFRDDGLLRHYRRVIASPTASAVRLAEQIVGSPAPTSDGDRGAGASGSFAAEVARFVRASWLIMQKDIVVEFRSRELLLTTIFFAASCVLVFAFALVREGRPMEDAAAGILWVSISFAGTLALGRTFEREQAHQTLQALLQAPIERGAIYIGKLLGLLALLLIVEVIVVPLVSLFFQATLLSSLSSMVMVGAFVIAGTVGLLAVGTMFSAMLVRTRSRDVLLPVLLYPMTVPVLLAGVRGTAAVIQATPDLPSARAWLAMLVFFNAVFLSLALWTFDAVTSE